MIDLILEFAGSYYMVRVNGNSILFGAKTGYDVQLAPIENLKLDYGGVIKEFPDLAENQEWKEIAIERFKEKLKEYNSEEDKLKYIIDDLSKWGYVPKYKQKQGFRTEVFK